ncbi:MAG: secretin and TonB N-terminal domain-containing protein [Candidatus Aureabacteria bacterium]|nr:secretin and TonB N-terminal domain-containing protein [Candidatus Auribacterota bacterium]
MKRLKKPFIKVFLGLLVIWISAGSAFAQTGSLGESSGLITISFRDAEIRDVLRALGDIGGVNIVVGKDVQGTVTVQLKDVGLEEALDAILTVNGYQYRKKGNIILVEKGDEILDSDVIVVNFANADEVKDMVEKLISEKGDVKVHEKLNELVITDYRKNIERAKTLISQIDQPPFQVRIETKIIEMEIGDLEKLGLRWKTKYSQYKAENWARDGDGNLVYDEDGNLISENWPSDDQNLYQGGETTFDLASDAGVNASSLTGGQLSIAEFASIAEKIRIGAAIDALVQDKRANILSAPSITTLDNKQASIVIGEKVGIREQTQTTTGTTESVRFEDVGIKLYVTPKISNNGYVTMHIRPEISNISVYTETQQRFSTTQAETNVRVKDGHSVIIGGLIKDDEVKTVRKVPLLGSIPIIGIPFRHKSFDRTKNEIVIFLTPRILQQGTFRTESTMSEATDYDAKRNLEAKETEKKMISNFSEAKKKDDIRDYKDEIEEDKDTADSYFKKAKSLESLAHRVGDERKIALFNRSIAYYLQVARDYKGLTKYPPEALYRAGKIYYKYLKRYDDAEAVFQEIVQDYPESRYARKALSYLSKIQKIREKQQ